MLLVPDLQYGPAIRNEPAFGIEKPRAGLVRVKLSLAQSGIPFSAPAARNVAISCHRQPRRAEMLLVSRLASARLRKGTIAQRSADMFKLSDCRPKLESVGDFQHSDARGLPRGRSSGPTLMAPPILIPSSSPAAPHHGAGKIPASGRHTPCCRTVSACATDRQTTHGRSFDGDVAIRQPPGRLAHER